MRCRALSNILSLWPRLIRAFFTGGQAALLLYGLPFLQQPSESYRKPPVLVSSGEHNPQQPDCRTAPMSTCGELFLFSLSFKPLSPPCNISLNSSSTTSLVAGQLSKPFFSSHSLPLFKSIEAFGSKGMWLGSGQWMENGSEQVQSASLRLPHLQQTSQCQGPTEESGVPVPPIVQVQRASEKLCRKFRDMNP